MANKPLSNNERKAIRYIRNSVVHRGRWPSVRELQAHLGYQSPRSASDILGQLEARGIIRRGPGEQRRLINAAIDEDHARTIDVPLVGRVPCGSPLLAEENIEAMIPVSTGLARPPHRYFLLRAVGTSMDRAGIHDGDLVLVKQQEMADNGDRVVAIIDDEATIKAFHRTDSAVILKPCSTEKSHKPILLTKDFRVQGIVVGAMPVGDF